MEMVALTPERKAQLDAYAHRHGKDATAVLDELLGAWLDEERSEYFEALEGVREGYADFEAGRIQSAESVFEELRVKYGLPR
jgi:predicted transcriptional regulator